MNATTRSAIEADVKRAVTQAKAGKFAAAVNAIADLRATFREDVTAVMADLHITAFDLMGGRHA